MLSVFYDVMNDTFEKCVPKSSIRSSSNPVWVNKQLCNLKNVRSREYRKLCLAKKLNQNADESKFTTLNEEYLSLQKNKHDEYIRDLGDSFKNNPKQFWNFVNSKRKGNSLPCKMNYNGSTATSDEEKYGTDQNWSAFIESRNDHGCFNLDITREEVAYALSTCDSNKGSGPDEMPPIFLRECAELLSLPLCLIFKKSIKDGIYPEMFKTGRITHIYIIHKSGRKANVTNYRGVTIICNIAKIFQLKITLSPQLSKQQHGFLSNWSIETNLMELTNYCHEAFENGHQVDVKKAFDSVNQPMMMRKLATYNIGNESLRWLNCYTHGRKQYVKIGSSASETFNAHSAVEQGSIYGPSTTPMEGVDRRKYLILLTIRR